MSLVLDDYTLAMTILVLWLVSQAFGLRQITLRLNHQPPSTNAVESTKAILSSRAASALLASAMLTFGAIPAQSATAATTKAEQLGSAKIKGGGASTLQSGRVIAITRGVNLDNTDWEKQDLKGVAFQQSVLRGCNFKLATLLGASFFDADLSGSSFESADMRQVNLEMADLSNTDLTNADLTQAYMAGAVIKNLQKIENTDWSEVNCGALNPYARNCSRVG